MHPLIEERTQLSIEREPVYYGEPLPTRYSAVAIVLHWLIAFAVLAQIALGFWMTDLPDSPPGEQARWFNLHKSIGITIGLLVVLRIAWRFKHRPPPLPSTLAHWQRKAAAFNHAALYICLFVVPLSGFLGSTFSGYPIRFFGWKLPNWGWDAPVLKELMSGVHYVAVCVFVLLVAVHLAAALKHLLIDRDGVFWRMCPRRRRRALPGTTR